MSEIEFKKPPPPPEPLEPEPTGLEAAMAVVSDGIDRLGTGGVAIAVVSVAILLALALLGRRAQEPRSAAARSRGSWDGGPDGGGDGD
jgi:hypothetical protein